MISCAVSGCSVDIPIPGFGPADTTAAIDTEASRLSPALTAEDWSLARLALKKALETPAGAPEPAEREGLACRDKAGQWSVRQARDRAKG